jgi:hypothetical protein
VTADSISFQCAGVRVDEGQACVFFMFVLVLISSSKVFLLPLPPLPQNCAIRRLQLAEARNCAFAMVPPIPSHPLRHAQAVQSRMVKALAPLSNLSAAATGARLASILVRTPVKGADVIKYHMEPGLPFVSAVGLVD